MNGFNINTTINNFLFWNWNATDLSEFVGICSVVFAMVIVLEAVKLLQAYVHKQVRANPITYAMTDENMAGRSPLLRSLVIPSSVTDIKYRRLKLLLSDSLVHVLHLSVGYLVMLSVMRYNAWIGIAVIMGSAVGFYIFGAVRHVYFESHPVEKKMENPVQAVHTESREPLFDSRELDASMQSIGEGTSTRVLVH